MTFLLQMSTEDKERIHEAMLTILEEMGILVENAPMLKKLEEFGAQVDHEEQIARFPKTLVREYLESNEPPDPDEGESWQLRPTRLTRRYPNH